MSGCYDRRNDENLNQYQCDTDPDSDFQTCCQQGDSCASNGLCVTSDDDALTPYFIHGCKVDDWDVDSCPTQCYNSTGNGIKPGGDGMYCCWGRNDCDCSDENETFYMGPIRIVASIAKDAEHVRSTTTASDLTSTSSVDAATDTDTTVSSTTTISPADTTALDPSTTSLVGESSDNDGSNLPIGLGVGLGVGIPLLALAAGLLWFLRKKRRAKATAGSVGQSETTTQVPPGSPGYNYNGHYPPNKSPSSHPAMSEVDGGQYYTARPSELDTNVSSQRSRFELQ